MVERGWRRAGAALVVAVVLTLGVVASAVLLSDPTEGPAPPAAADGAEPAKPPAKAREGTVDDQRPALVRALAVLRAWDARRARAWTDGDAAALRRLYLPGSTAARSDVAMLRAWQRRGVLPDDLEVQVLAGRLRPSRPGTLRLLVTDRVEVSAPDVGGLPEDAASTRLVVLQRAAADGSRPSWRVAAVYDRPAATTSATPRSEKR